MRYTNNTPEFFVIVLCLFLVVSVIFIVVDRVSGSTKLVMATISDKYHEIDRTTRTDEGGNRHTSTTHYYWVYFNRDDGKKDRMDVGSWNFGSYVVSERIVVNYTVGGKSGMEYLCGIEKFTGAEVN